MEALGMIDFAFTEMVAVRLFRRRMAATKIQRAFRKAIQGGLRRLEPRVVPNGLQRAIQGGLRRFEPRVVPNGLQRAIQGGLRRLEPRVVPNGLQRIYRPLQIIIHHPFERVYRDLVKSRYTYHPVLDNLLRRPSLMARSESFPEGPCSFERIRYGRRIPKMEDAVFQRNVSELRKLSPLLRNTSFQKRAIYYTRDLHSVPLQIQGVSPLKSDTVIINHFFATETTQRDTLMHEGAHIIDCKSSGRFQEDHDLYFQWVHNMLYAEAVRQGNISYEDMITTMERVNKGPFREEAYRLWLTLGL